MEYIFSASVSRLRSQYYFYDNDLDTIPEINNSQLMHLMHLMHPSTAILVASEYQYPNINWMVLPLRTPADFEMTGKEHIGRKQQVMKINWN